MAYDRDSFLAGLAVGRTLWKPHTTEQLSALLALAETPEESEDQEEAEAENADR